MTKPPFKDVDVFITVKLIGGVPSRRNQRWCSGTVRNSFNGTIILGFSEKENLAGFKMSRFQVISGCKLIKLELIKST